MRIFLVGGTGFIGRRLAAALRAAGHEVTGGGRESGDLARDSVERWTARLAGIEILINAAGLIQPRRGEGFESIHADGPRRLFAASVAAGVRRFLHVSALGADAGAVTEFHRSKFAGERSFREQDPNGQRLDWCVLRPSLVIGRGGGSTALFAALAALPYPLRLGPGRWVMQPIPIEELVATVLQLVVRPQKLPRHLDLVGPAPVTTDALTQTLRAWLRLTPRRFVTMPEPILRFAARIGTLLGGGAIAGETLAMLRRGNVGDPTLLQDVLGRPVLGIADALARDPATLADRWQARLYFLPAPLRLALAFMWIATGVLSLGVYPVEDSFELLGSVGLSATLASVALYGAALADLLLGLLLLLRWRPVLVGALQIALMAGFTLIITLALPEWWLHPFGPVTKNLPIAVATLVMMALEADR